MNKKIKDSLGFHWSNLVPYILIGIAIWWIVGLVQENADLKVQNEGFIEVMNFNSKTAQEAKEATEEIRNSLKSKAIEQKGRKDGKITIYIP